MCQYFSFWMPFQNPKQFLGVYGLQTTKQLFIGLHYSQSQELPSNPIRREGSAAAGRLFPCRCPRPRIYFIPSLLQCMNSTQVLSPCVYSIPTYPSYVKYVLVTISMYVIYIRPFSICVLYTRLLSMFLLETIAPFLCLNNTITLSICLLYRIRPPCMFSIPVCMCSIQALPL